jgi:ribosome-associated protein
VDELQISRSCRIPVSEIEWRFSASGGPGGQHANRSNTRVEARFDVGASLALSDSQRRRLRSKLGDVVSVVVDDERSQTRNRTIALERLQERLAAALVVPKLRRPTKPSRGAKRRRLEHKRQHSEKKKLRRRPDD